MSLRDDQSQVIRIVDAGDDEAVIASEFSISEFSSFGLSSMHASLHAFYPDEN